MPTKNDEFKRLPNTTLYGKFDTMAEAVSAFYDLIAATREKIGARVLLEKLLMIDSCEPVRIRSDETKTKSAQGTATVESATAHGNTEDGTTLIATSAAAPGIATLARGFARDARP